MITKKRIFLVTAGLIFLMCLVVQDIGAQSVTLNPSYAQRNVGGKVRMHIQMNGATDLLSMGVKIQFPPNLLQVLDAKKNTSVWRFAELEPDPLAYFPEVEIDNTNGVVKMIGGRLVPGISGNVLLGWIVFQCSNLNTGSANVSVSLANDFPFNNFVRQDGTVDDGSITFTNANICIVSANACEGDFNKSGKVYWDDYARFSASWNKTFPDPKYDPACDFNASGSVFWDDYAIFSADWNKTCPSCP